MPSLYVHIPFCQKKCSYCAFFSVPDAKPGLVESYLQGVEKEIQLRLMEAPVGVSSLFLGGGTPTMLSVEQLDRLLNNIHQQFVFVPQNSDEVFMEKTVEANPGTLESGKLEVMRHYGVNRISLGVQSFNDHLLKSAGRIHSGKDIYNSVKLIRKSGIENLNLDLIFGLPGQDMNDWQAALQKAVELTPEHLSLYALTVEEGTPLADCEAYAAKRDLLPDDDLQTDMYELAAGYLKSRGYLHYEISNFAKPGFECRHNSSYWLGDDYIGLGPGAVSCLQGVRSKNLEDIPAFQRQLGLGLRPIDFDQNENLTRDQLISEYMMLGLRTSKGIDTGQFARKFGQEIQDIYGRILANYMARRIILFNNERLTIDPAYYFVANSIIREFIN